MLLPSDDITSSSALVLLHGFPETAFVVIVPLLQVLAYPTHFIKQMYTNVFFSFIAGLEVDLQERPVRALLLHVAVRRHRRRKVFHLPGREPLPRPQPRVPNLRQRTSDAGRGLPGGGRRSLDFRLTYEAPELRLSKQVLS